MWDVLRDCSSTSLKVKNFWNKPIMTKKLSTIIILIFLSSATFAKSSQLKLIKVTTDDIGQKETLQNIGVEIAEEQKDFAICFANQEQLGAIRQRGLMVEILDEEIPRLIEFGIRDGLDEAISDLDILEAWQGRIKAIARKKQIEELEKRACEIDVLEENIYERLKPRVAAASIAQYHSYADVESILHQLASDYPDICEVLDIGDSVEGRQIWAIRISDEITEDDEQEPNILFVGCHHAREWISVEVPLSLACHLVENYETDERVKAMVDSGQIYIAPILNPDGLEYSRAIWTQRLWRKNRGDNGDGTFGVDLNRNYGYKWGGVGSSGDTNSETYRGPSPFSEPETRAIRDLMQAHKFAVAVGYHNYGQLILYPWGYTSEGPSDLQSLDHLARYMAKFILAEHEQIYIPQQGYDLYVTSGDMGDWVYGIFNIPVFTIELRPKGGSHPFELPEDQILPTFEENLPAALYLIEWTQSTDRLTWIESVDVDRFREGVPLSSNESLTVGDEIVVGLVGEPNGVANFSISRVTGEIPMDEGEPGNYYGDYQIKSGDDAENAPLIVTLRDAIGNVGTNDQHQVTINTNASTIKLGDVSGDGSISALDASIILRYVVGIIDEFPAQSNVSPTYEKTANYKISLPNMQATPGSRIRVPITVRAVPVYPPAEHTAIDTRSATLFRGLNPELLAGGITLTFDPSALKPISVSATPLLKYWDYRIYLSQRGEAVFSEIRIAFVNTTPLIYGGEIFSVDVEVLPTVTEGIQVAITLKDVQLNVKADKQDGRVDISPAQTVLSQNFPNPFNPHTWIPYKLQQPANVIIRIYNLNGQLVRMLNIGQKQPGVYMDKSKAAHWDGRNDSGEQISSGAYFYQIQAGNFSAMRKLVLNK